jgi:hypothetical protein
MKSQSVLRFWQRHLVALLALLVLVAVETGNRVDVPYESPSGVLRLILEYTVALPFTLARSAVLGFTGGKASTALEMMANAGVLLVAVLVDLLRCRAMPWIRRRRHVD